MYRTILASLVILAILMLALSIPVLTERDQPGLAIPVSPGGTDLNAEIAWLRALEARQDWERLADFLDRCIVGVPAGEFLRGSTAGRWDEIPELRVYLDAYAIDRYEVTNLQYRRFLVEVGGEAPPYWSGNAYPQGQALYPVVGVTWEQAAAYCRWVGERLPTEAEWEKACRSTDGWVYPWGDAWDPQRGNVDPSAGSFHFPDQPGVEPDLWKSAWTILQATPASPEARGLRSVGSYPQGASLYGILDLVGNASEWVADWYGFADYTSLPSRNPITLSPQWNHALRGSSWYDPNGGMDWIRGQSRCSARNSSHERLDARVGFRCAKSSGTRS